MNPRTKDSLESALDFVIRRIHEQSQLSSLTLNEEDEETLVDLPEGGVNYVYSEFGASLPMPPERSYDKLVKLTKLAIKQDRENNPDVIRQWESADAVLRQNKHRLAWLIERGGIECQELKPKRSRWDPVLLFLSALVTVIVGLAIMGSVIFYFGH